MKKFILLVIFLLVNILVSISVCHLFLKSKSFVSFVNEHREENELYGFFEINGKTYYQIYTTTQVNLGNGLHYHKIDIRTK